VTAVDLGRQRFSLVTAAVLTAPGSVVRLRPRTPYDELARAG
jgi:hypothetical protein